jgi:hypothetical protein
MEMDGLVCIRAKGFTIQERESLLLYAETTARIGAAGHVRELSRQSARGPF